MKRIAGEWMLFLLLALPGLIENTIRTGFRWRDGDRQVVPVVYEFSGTNVLPVSQELPPAFISRPLFFFSTAPPESLALLPGVGPVLAARIREARGGKRPFKDWDDLLRVRGIGEKSVARFKRLARRDTPTEP